MNKVVLSVLALMALLCSARAQDPTVEAQNEFRSLAVPSLFEPTKGAQTGVFSDASPISTQVVALRGNPTFSVTALHTVASGTVEVHVLLWAQTSTAGVYSSCGVADKVTFTASASTTTEVVNSVTYYPATEILDYSPRGATHYEVRVVGVPSGGGSVRVKTWAHAFLPVGQ